MTFKQSPLICALAVLTLFSTTGLAQSTGGVCGTQPIPGGSNGGSSFDPAYYSFLYANAQAARQYRQERAQQRFQMQMAQQQFLLQQQQLNAARQQAAFEAQEKKAAELATARRERADRIRAAKAEKRARLVAKRKAARALQADPNAVSDPNAAANPKTATPPPVNQSAVNQSAGQLGSDSSAVKQPATDPSGVAKNSQATDKPATITPL